MKFACERCRTRYSISDEKVRRKVLKIRCKTCGNVMVVREETPGVAATGGNTGVTVSPSTQKVAQPKPAAPKQDEKRASVEWYVAIKGQQFGPMNEDDIVDLFLKGKIHDRSYCWNEGLKGWTRLRELPEFAKLLKSAPPPAPAKKPPPPPMEETSPEPQQTEQPRQPEQRAQPAPQAEPRVPEPASPEPAAAADSPTPAPEQQSKQEPASSSGGLFDAFEAVSSAFEPSEQSNPAQAVPPPSATHDDPFAAVVAQSSDLVSGEGGSQPAPRESTRVFIMNAGLHNRARKHRTYAAAFGVVCIVIGALGYMDYQGYIKVPLLNSVVTAAAERAGIEPPPQRQENFVVYGDDDDSDAKLKCKLLGNCPEKKKKKRTKRGNANLDNLDGIGDLDLDGSFNSKSGARGGGIRRSGAADLGELDPFSSSSSDSKKLRNLFSEKGKSRIEARDRKADVTDRSLVTTDGQSLSAEQISTVVQQRIGSIQSCINKAIKNGSTVQGKHYIVLTIDPRGRVMRSRIKDRVVNLSPVGECIGKSTRKWRFPPFSGEAMDIEIPVVLGGP